MTGYRRDDRMTFVVTSMLTKNSRRPFALILALGIALLWPVQSARAWGRLGHRASARLTESLLTPHARSIIRDLLEPGEYLADASTWADEVSRDIPGSAGWHFVNVRITSNHYSPEDCRRGGCVVTKIPEFRAIVADRNAPRLRRREALRFLIHLVQDLHQPMHVADRNDRGGNNVQLRYGRYDYTNLHQLWDSGLISRRYRERDLVRELEDIAHTPTARDWSRGRIEDWANETLAVGRRAYQANPGTNVMFRTGDTVSLEYEKANTPVAVEQLARAGVRLAMILNDTLK
jgi:hypothetical protein